MAEVERIDVKIAALTADFFRDVNAAVDKGTKTLNQGFGNAARSVRAVEPPLRSINDRLNDLANMGRIAGKRIEDGFAAAAERGKQLGFVAGQIKEHLRTIGIAAGAGAAAITGVGVLSIKTAADFETLMARIAGLTSTPADQVGDLREQILAMSKALPRSPQELGAAAYFILSSGIEDVATAMKILEFSAKASVAGLGETKVIANILTSVMNAYQLSAEDAAFATDSLVKAVRLGKGEPHELAQAVGFVIPVAAQMGVEFAQVGAVLATLTNTGLGVENAVTALKGVFTQLLSPSTEAAEIFEKLVINIEDFRKEVDRDFIGAMSRLVGLIEANSDELGSMDTVIAQLFPDIRGMTGVMAAFGNQLAQTEFNAEGMAAATGSLDTALTEVEKTTAYNFAQALAAIQVALIEFGSIALPLATKAITMFTNAMQVFNDLPGPVKTLIVIVTALTAVLLTLVAGMSFVAIGFFALSAAAAAAKVSLLSLAATAGILTLAIAAIAAVIATVVIAMPTIIRGFNGVKVSLDAATAAAARYAEEFAGLSQVQIGDAGASKIKVLADRYHELAAAERDALIETTKGGIAGAWAELNAKITGFKSPRQEIEDQKNEIIGLIKALHDAGFSYEEIQAKIDAVDPTLNTAIALWSLTDKTVAEFQDTLARVELKKAADDWGAFNQKLVEAAPAASRLDVLANVMQKLSLTTGGLDASALGPYNDALKTLFTNLELTPAQLDALGKKLVEVGAIKPEGLAAWEQMLTDMKLPTVEIDNALAELGITAPKTAEEIEEMTKRIDSAISDLAPSFNETFDEWKTRLDEMALAYSTFENNLAYILGQLKANHVANADDIIAGIRAAGPEMTYAMAYNIGQGNEAAKAELFKDFGAVFGQKIAAAATEAGGTAKESGQYLGQTITEWIRYTIENGNLGASMNNAILRAGTTATQIAARSGAQAGLAYIQAFASKLKQLEDMADIPNVAGKAAAKDLAKIYNEIEAIPPIELPVITAPTAPLGSITGTGAAGGAAKELTPEDIMQKSAQVADAIANAIKNSVEAFQKLAAFDPSKVDFGKIAALGKLLRDTTIEFGRYSDDAGFELSKRAGEWADSAGKVVSLLGSAADAFEKIRNFRIVGADTLAEFDRHLQFVVSYFGSLTDSWHLQMSDAAGRWAEGAEKFVSLLNTAADAFDRIRNFTSVGTDAMGEFDRHLQYLVSYFGYITDSWHVSMADIAGQYADGAGKFISLLGGAADAFDRIRDFQIVGTDAMAEFNRHLEYIVSFMGSILGQWELDMSNVVGRWSEGAGKFFGLLGNAADAFEKLRGARFVSTDTLALFADRLKFVVSYMASIITQFDIDAAKVAGEWADSAGKVVTLMGNAIDVLGKLNDLRFPSFSRITQVAEAARDIILEFNRVLDQMLIDATARGATPSENAVKILALVSGAVDVLVKMKNIRFPPAGRIASIAENAREALLEFGRILTETFDDLMVQGLDWVDKATAVFDLIIQAIDALKAINQFRGLSPTALAAFGQAIRDLMGELGGVTVQATIQSSDGEEVGLLSHILDALHAILAAIDRLPEAIIGGVASFAQGGFIPSGQEMLALLHGPEWIVPEGVMANARMPAMATVGGSNTDNSRRAVNYGKQYFISGPGRQSRDVLMDVDRMVR